MGNSYFVPRNVKGESRILYIFTVKSFIFTLVFGIIGLIVWFIISAILGVDSLVGTIICVVVFGVIGYLLGALKIPDSPLMGVFQKAGGEYLSDIIVRFITFGKRKKIYIYNYNRAKSVTKEMNADKKEVND